MNSIYDVQQLLKKYGSIVYMGNRVADLEMMEDEVRELYQARLISLRDFQTAILLIRQEKAKLR